MLEAVDEHLFDHRALFVLSAGTAAAQKVSKNADAT